MRFIAWLLAAAAALAAETPPLIEAIRGGDEKAVAGAIGKAADVNVRDDKGVTALMYAVMYGSAETVKLLLNRGADVNATNPSGGTALMTAAPDAEKVRLLVEKGANVSVRSSRGATALSTALRLPSGSDSARYLLAHGAKPDAQALNLAVGRGKTDIATLILDSGVAASTTLLDVAAGSGNEATVQMLLRRGPASSRKLMDLAYWGMTRSLQTVLEQGAGDINAKDNRGRTALMYAAGSDNPKPETVRLLLAKGADASIKDVRGDTALDWARLRNHPQMVRALGGTVAALPETKLLPAGDTLPEIKDAVQRAMSRMEPAGPAFFKANGCISCHNQSIYQMAAAAVRGKAIRLDEKVRTAQINSVLGVWASHHSEMWESRCSVGGGSVATMTYGLVGLHAEKQPQTPLIEAVVHCLASFQDTDGSWGMVDQRSPLGFSNIKYTALAVSALRAYTLPGRKAELEQRILRARRYLVQANAGDTQDVAFQILGLRWAGGEERQIRSLAERLASWQRSDGGWAQHPEMAPDAFATAEAAWSLWEGARRSTSDTAYQNGVLWLRRAQKEDGSWHVRSRGFGFQPYRETGFPYSHDQWLSTAATGFAILALAPLLELHGPETNRVAVQILHEHIGAPLLFLRRP